MKRYPHPFLILQLLVLALMGCQFFDEAEPETPVQSLFSVYELGDYLEYEFRSREMTPIGRPEQESCLVAITITGLDTIEGSLTLDVHSSGVHMGVVLRELDSTNIAETDTLYRIDDRFTLTFHRVPGSPTEFEFAMRPADSGLSWAGNMNPNPYFPSLFAEPSLLAGKRIGDLSISRGAKTERLREFPDSTMQPRDFLESRGLLAYASRSYRVANAWGKSALCLRTLEGAPVHFEDPKLDMSL